jgi:hypothetical protein
LEPRPQSDVVAFLAHRDHPCPGCQYNLRGITVNRCPECNQLLKLQVGLVEPKVGALIAGTAGLCGGLGFCVIVGGWGVAVGKSRPSQIAPLIVGVVVLAVLLWAWVKIRRHVHKLTSTQVWTFVVLCYAAPAVFIAWFMAMVSY